MQDVKLFRIERGDEIEEMIDIGPEGLVGPQGPTGTTLNAAGVGVPIGGTAGQLLKKNSSTDYDTSWDTITQDDISDGITYKQYSDTEKTKLANITGINTGDNAVNSLYSGLEANKQDTFIVGPGLNLTLGTLRANATGTNTGDETQATIKTKLGAATTSVDGYLTSTDWNTFNGKQASGSYEVTTNKVTSISGASTDTQYPSAKLTYDQLALKAPLISPSFTTPSLGVATATSINGATITSGTLNGSVTGTNTGDQTSIVGITGTKAQFNTAVSDGDIIYSGDALGTPSSGTVTNLTGTASININGTVGATTPTTGKFTTVETTGNIELGHASDTTLSRVSAGVVAIEGVNIVKAGSITTDGITMNTGKLLGRNTASAGAIEEITLGTGLSMTGTTLNATGGSGLNIFTIRSFI